MDEAGDTHDGQGYRQGARPDARPARGGRTTRAGSSRILVGVNSALSGIPVDRRRRLAATLGLFAVLFVTVGVVALTGTTPGVVRVFSAIALAVSAVLGLAAWGVVHSITVDLAEQRLDAAIEAAVAQRGGVTALTCGCGHDHDPDELHVTDADAEGAACAHDGSGAACAHNCDTCVLAAMRPSPSRSRAERLTQ